MLNLNLNEPGWGDINGLVLRVGCRVSSTSVVIMSFGVNRRAVPWSASQAKVPYEYG